MKALTNAAVLAFKGPLPLGVLLGIPGLIFGSLYLVPRLSGWSQLARRFTATGEFRGQTWKFCSAQMRNYMGYNNCLTIGSSPEGLYLAFMLKVAHRPLLIPWHEITFAGERKFLFVRLTEFRLGSEEQLPFAVQEELGREIARGRVC